MDDVKRLGTPLLIIVLSAFLTKLVETWLKGGFVHTLLIIIMVASLFMFGVSLNRKKRSNAVFARWSQSLSFCCCSLCSWVIWILPL